VSILEINGVTKRFGGLVAVNDVSLSVDEAEIYGLIGPNGAGKSVLLNCIAGASRPDEGRIIFAGHDTTGWSPERMCHAGLARTFQIPRPFPRMTALETVLVAAEFGAARGSRSVLHEAHRGLERVAFPHADATRVVELNAVDLKRLDLARALASRPSLLLLDELAAGLMTGQLGGLMSVIRDIRASGVAVIMVEHVLPTILGLCDRLAVLDFGKKIADGSTDEVANDEGVVDAYLGGRSTKRC
jgi:branched-chain amino acid transport system ATP-binding protein